MSERATVGASARYRRTDDRAVSHKRTTGYAKQQIGEANAGGVPTYDLRTANLQERTAHAYRADAYYRLRLDTPSRALAVDGS